jgi:hypothetical protein
MTEVSIILCLMTKKLVQVTWFYHLNRCIAINRKLINPSRPPHPNMKTAGERVGEELDRAQSR